MNETNHHPDDMIGQRLGSYRLKALLGRSRVSSVYRAEDVVLGRDVAVKVLPRWMVQEDRQRVEAFLSEARSAAQLQNSHVVTIYHVGQHAEHYYVAMEHMSGGSLQDVLDRGQRLSPTAAATAIRQAARGLAAAHRAGIIHRDVKLSNLLMTEDGVVKVADFGLAGRVELAGESGKASVVEGTPRYVAPELCLGHPPSPASDIYGLGMTWFALLAGAPAFSGKDSAEIFRKHLRAPVPDIGRTRPDVPLPHVSLISQCLAKLPEDRFETGQAFLQALEATMTPAAEGDEGARATLESDSLRDLIVASRAAAVKAREASAETTQAAAAAGGQAGFPSIVIPVAVLAVLAVLAIAVIALLWRMAGAG